MKLYSFRLPFVVVRNRYVTKVSIPVFSVTSKSALVGKCKNSRL